MNAGHDNEILITRYLLGELPDGEQCRVEDRLFADSDFFHQVEATRDELIDDYLQGELSGPARERLEDYFLASPARRERVESARALLQAVSRVAVADRSAEPPEKPASWRSAWAAFFGAQTKAARLVPVFVMLFVILAGLWLVVETLRARNQLAQARAERAALEQREQELTRQLAEQRQGTDDLSARLRQEQSERDRLAAELAALKATEHGVKPEQSLIASLLLSPILVRDADETPKLIIGSGVKSVRLQAQLEGDQYASYRAALQTVEGATVLQRAGLRAVGKTVVLQLPAEVFKAGDYLLTLSGVNAHGEVDDIGKYYFRVHKH